MDVRKPLRSLFTPIGSFVLLLIFARTVQANSISSSAYLFPGVHPMNPIFGGLGTILAAIIERPFLRQAGIESNTLRVSLRANFLSLVVGFLWMILGITLLSFVPLVYILLSIGISIGIEGGFIRSKAPSSRWSFIVAGNILSAFVLVVISIGTDILRESYRGLPRRVEPHLSDALSDRCCYSCRIPNLHTLADTLEAASNRKSKF